MYQFLVTLTLTSDLVEIKLFQNMIKIHIKLKGMKYTTYKKKIDLTRTLDVGSKGQTIFFLKMVRLHIKGSLTVWALYAYFSDSQNAAFELLVCCMKYQCNR